ncbi:hypothetical protein TNCT_660441 [Trichonephila clavata]|uniref:Uncharacterized protein n=1 Tax=Trichonephila clavata TaxID=2740835 RepID=A0A8X6IMM7_TRICU|nr:hypothetical protein TNCT_660441 [Trichonephila clavata]
MSSKSGKVLDLDQSSIDFLSQLGPSYHRDLLKTSTLHLLKSRLPGFNESKIEFNFSGSLRALISFALLSMKTVGGSSFMIQYIYKVRPIICLYDF